MRSRPRIGGAIDAGLLAGAAMLLAGCMVGPDYVRPTAPAPAAFKEAEGWKPAQPADTAPRGNWWEVFADADLDALEQQAELANQTVQAAAARVREAQAATQAMRAGLFPGVSGNAAAARSARSSGASSIANSSNLGLDARWEVDLWGRVRRGVEASEATAQSAAADLAAAKLSVQALLAQNYLLLRV